jgi:REP-associated tyrosine transposase
MPWNLKRFQESRQTHFVTFSCYHRLPRLANAETYTLFLEALEAARIRFDIRIYGYVLMPEHVHLLLSEPESSTLATPLRALKISTAKKVRVLNLREAAAPFWQTRYYDRNIRDYDEFMLKLRYLHRNPVKRGFCQSPEEWPWSSFRHYQTGVRGIVEIESEWTARLRERQKTPG